MDTSDRHDSTLPARSSAPLPPVLTQRGAATLAGVGRESMPGSAPTMQVDPVSILRGLLRNSWKILGLWLLASAPLTYLIYYQVKPKYTAISRLRMQLTQPELYPNSSSGEATERTVAIQTEIDEIRSPSVLQLAVANPEVSNRPFVKNSVSPATDLQERLMVTNTRNTSIVVVAFESEDPDEAAAIVNAVVAAYNSSYDEYKTGSDKVLKNNLDNYLKTMQASREAKQKALDLLIDQGVDTKSLITRVASSDRPGEEPAVATVQDLSLEQLKTLKNQLVEVQIELIAAKSRLESRAQDFQDADQVVETGADATALPKEEIDRRIAAEFRNDPLVADLYSRRQDVERRRDHVAQGARKGADPAKRAHDAHWQELTDEIEGLWQDRYHELRRMVMAAGAAPPSEIPGEPQRKTVKELREDVAELERKQASVLKLLAEAEVEKNKSNSATYRAQFLQAEISSMQTDEKLVNRRLQELEFRSTRGMVRVDVTSPATPPKKASDSKRLKLMAAAPMGILALLVGLFALLEVKAERVGNPDALSSRVQSEVYSLPPIPMARSPRRLGAPGDDDHIDRFIQRLDHLRFAVCGDHPDVGLGRCVLISSAVGGEGKTTLAAQLAARCGHSGHSTLLIDADLRRGSLCPLLDVAEGPGLGDVLMNEGLNVEDLVIPVQGGTFHLLSAGTPTSDTSRIFQGRAFGMLIARLRQLYDLIIIDSPPILPVPDALIMGRWTDGVVLASRYDVSRAPQVERARRQLDLAGIPVLGTVINGMRTSDSYYGRYTYSRQQPERERPADATSEG